MRETQDPIPNVGGSHGDNPIPIEVEIHATDANARLLSWKLLIMKI